MNNYTINGDHIVMTIDRPSTNVSYNVLIDLIDEDLLKNHWSINMHNNLFYLTRVDTHAMKVYYLHRIIAERITGRSLSVKDRVRIIDKYPYILNLRRSNIEVGSYIKVIQSRRGWAKSGIKGVYERNVNGRQCYVSIRKLDGKMHMIGYGKDKKQLEQLYLAWCNERRISP